MTTFKKKILSYFHEQNFDMLGFQQLSHISSELKGLCQLESMRAEVMQITFFNCQNPIVFNAWLSLSVTSKAQKFRERLTSELGLDKGYF